LVVLATFPLNIAASIVQVQAIAQIQTDEEQEQAQQASTSTSSSTSAESSKTSAAISTAAQAAGAVALVRVDSINSDSGLTLDDASSKSARRKAAQTAEDEYLLMKDGAEEEGGGEGGGGGGGVVSGGHAAVLSSAFTNMRTVCAFSMQHKVADHYSLITSRKSLLRMGKSYQAGVAFGFGQATQFFIYGLLFWYRSIPFHSIEGVCLHIRR
jgi:hypothetical protein